MFANRVCSRTIVHSSRSIARTIVHPCRSIARTKKTSASSTEGALIAKLFGQNAGAGGFPIALRNVFDTSTDHANLVNLVADADSDVIDVCFDLGRNVTIHFRTGPPLTLQSKTIDATIIGSLAESMTTCDDVFAATGRMGIEGTLHRVSALNDFDGTISGLTWRIGREVSFHEVLTDDLKGYLALGNSVLFFGRPGAGKTTALRGAATYLGDCVPKRTIVVDATGELGGWSAQPIGIGMNTRRMCVSPGKSHGDAMMAAIRNHTPQALIVDEIMTRSEAALAQTCRARGIQLVATCHASGLADVVENPVFADLVGGSQNAAISDASAAQRGSKFVRARKHAPVFDGAYDVETKTLYPNLSKFVDEYFEYYNV